ncbi:mechanosensitive ion channel family protein [Synechococcus sp. PCC 7336]|uniref:mechanosensitive ion channel family protein n=1 Tax=Synechococcus sp. PCC 7336 TaxID=195250 RepID=UPI00034BD669|nr:mechanosensitive ion channel family protein [Synechococcus sp. PCC 7336]
MKVRDRRWLVGLLLGAIASLAFSWQPAPAANPPQFVAQFPDLGLDELVNPRFESFDSEIETSWVVFDGRQVILVAAPAAMTSPEESEPISPADNRARQIERQLRAIAREAVASPTLPEVRAVREDGRGFLVIEVDGQYLMSVTNLDAQIAGVSLPVRAQEIVKSVDAALLRARQERSHRYLVRQGIVAGLLVAGLAGSSLFICWLKKQSSRQHERTLAQLEEETADLAPSEDLEAPPSDNIDEATEVKRVAAEQAREEQKKRIQMHDDLFQFWLQLALISIWLVGLLYGLGLFVQTRPLQLIALRWIQGSLFQLAAVILVVYVLLRSSYVGINRLFAAISEGSLWRIDSTSDRLSKRIQTISGVLKSIATIAIVGGGILVGLSVLSINIGPILAGAGILGLAVSFGAQSLVKDVINGFFILLEDQFSVGDVIATSGVAGFVEDLNLRVTRLRSADGNLIVIPNGNISTVENLTNGFSRANLSIEVAYNTDLDLAIATIGKTANDMAADPDWKELIVQDPQVLGVDAFGDNSITIRIWIDTQPLKQWSVAREFRLRLKKALDRAGISIPFPQRSIWFESPLRTLDKSLNESELQQLVTLRSSGREGK